MKQKWRDIRPYILAPILYGIVSSLLATLKLEVRGWDRYKKLDGAYIFAGFHGRVVFGAKFFRGKGLWTLISHSRDGEMQNRIFTKFGFKTIRGSTGRGGAKALIESIKVLKSGDSMTFPPDGPRGPSGVVQPGIMQMAKKTGALLVPVGVSANRRWLFKSWDRYLIPKPFSKGIMIFGDPIDVPADSSEEQLEQIRAHFESELHRLETAAETHFNFPKPNWHAPEAKTNS